MEKELVLVLDFGGQYNQLIARRIREQSVFCEMVPFDISYDKLIARNPKGIILSGGPASIYLEEAPLCDPRIFSLGIPVLGICYGMQLLIQQLGGTVKANQLQEYANVDLQANQSSLLFKDIGNPTQVWMSQGDLIESLPEGFQIDAATGDCPIAACSHAAKKIYGIQFHPEAKHTLEGTKILRNFLFEVCGLKGDWDLNNYIDAKVKEIQHQVGNKKVLCGLSGGVDSAVAAALVHKAVGDQLICVYVDTGLMRKGESEQVIETFDRHMHMNLIFVDAGERFLGKLVGVKDPEMKRKIIGTEFIRVFEEEAKKLGKIDYLVQGTIYPDVVESGTKTAQTIKSHHNVGGLPEDMQFELVEPLRLLFKDEVRAIGTHLGLDDEIVWRQPFPGPGLGVRVLEEVTPEKVKILQEADYILREEIKNAGLEREIWQYFAVLPPMRSVGVKEDERTYAYPVILRAVTSDDAMTAEWVHIPYEILDRMAHRIVNEVSGVNRVAYDITSKPPGTIEWE